MAGKLVFQHLIGLGPGVAFLRDVRQHDLPGPIPDDLLQDLCAVFIVEMTVIVDDALFDVNGPAGLHQHLHIVVAFKDVIVGIADPFLHRA